MFFNQQKGESDNIKLIKEKYLECVDDFKYLGSWMQSTKKDVTTTIGFILDKELRIAFFRAAVESITGILNHVTGILNHVKGFVPSALDTVSKKLILFTDIERFHGSLFIKLRFNIKSK